MDVILLQDVAGLGAKGEVVSAADGYVRNFLMPRKLAELATPGRVAEVRRRQEAEETRAKREAERAGEVTELLGKTVITVTAQAGEDGRLFGSVTAADVAQEIFNARQVKIDKKKVSLAEPIKETGDYMVDVEVQPGAVATMKVMVVAAR